jgi:phosphatidate cytidylyltransferase
MDEPDEVTPQAAADEADDLIAELADESQLAAAEAEDSTAVAAPFTTWHPDDEEVDDGVAESVDTAAEEPFAAWEPGDDVPAIELVGEGADDTTAVAPEDVGDDTGLPPKRDLFAPWEEPDVEAESSAEPDEADLWAPEDGSEPEPAAAPWEEPEAAVEAAESLGETTAVDDEWDSEPGLASAAPEPEPDAPAPWDLAESGDQEGWEEAESDAPHEEPLAPATVDDWVGGPPEDAGGEWSGEIPSGAGTTEHRGLADAIAQASTEETELQALSAAIPGLESGVVGFEDVEDLGTDEEGAYVPPTKSDLGIRVLTGLTLLALLLGALWAGGAVLAVFIGLVIMVGMVEYYTTLRQRGYAPLALFGYLGAIGSLAGAWFAGPIAIPGAVLATAAAVYAFYAFAPQRRDALTNGALTVFGVVWVAGAASLAMPIVDSPDYGVLVLALVAATVAMDVGAYGFGRAWGSAQLAPILSPNKSIEGLAGGVVLTIGVSLAIGYLVDPFDIQAGAALGLLVAVLAPLGDLAESMFKRSLGVKDMGTILPGHGGVLDRVDALLFVIPAAWVLYETLGYLS